jgi:hypothetical protein
VIGKSRTIPSTAPGWRPIISDCVDNQIPLLPSARLYYAPGCTGITIGDDVDCSARLPTRSALVHYQPIPLSASLQKRLT